MWRSWADNSTEPKHLDSLLVVLWDFNRADLSHQLITLQLFYLSQYWNLKRRFTWLQLLHIFPMHIMTSDYPTDPSLLFAGKSAWEWGEHRWPRELPRESAEHREVAYDHEAEAGVLPQPCRKVEHRGSPAWSWGVCLCVLLHICSKAIHRLSHRHHIFIPGTQTLTSTHLETHICGGYNKQSILPKQFS